VIQAGQRYRTKVDLPVVAMTSWAAPFTDGHDRVLDAGEEFLIENAPPSGATAVYGIPVDYHRLHSKMVPWTDRLQFWYYRGYYLCLQIVDIEQRCELLPPKDPR
jgi:hypothetical protein